MENNNQVFLYTVKPRRVIVGLSGSNRAIRTNKSLYLTKEDVFICLKNATVYRRFANEGINERVTIDDVERVHREKYISVDDWKKYCETKMSADQGKVIAQASVLETNTKNKNNSSISEQVLTKAVEKEVKKEIIEETLESDDDLEIEKEETVE